MGMEKVFCEGKNHIEEKKADKIGAFTF